MSIGTIQAVGPGPGDPKPVNIRAERRAARQPAPKHHGGATVIADGAMIGGRAG